MEQAKALARKPPGVTKMAGPTKFITINGKRIPLGHPNIGAAARSTGYTHGLPEVKHPRECPGCMEDPKWLQQKLQAVDYEHELMVRHGGHVQGRSNTAHDQAANREYDRYQAERSQLAGKLKALGVKPKRRVRARYRS
jgi:hypothetical protein